MQLSTTSKPFAVLLRLLPGVLLLLISLLFLPARDAHAENAPAGGTIPPTPPLAPVVYWTNSAIDPTALKQRDFDAVADAEGNLHVVYVALRDDHEVLMYAKGEPGAWTLEEIAPAVEFDPLGDMPILDPQIVLDADGAPHVAYYNWIDNSGSDKIHYAHKTGNIWPNTTLAGATTDKITPFVFDLTMTSNWEPLLVVQTLPAGADPYNGSRLNALVLQNGWVEKPIGGQFVVAARIAADTDGSPCIFFATNEYGIGESMLSESCYRNNEWTADVIIGSVTTYKFDVHFDTQGYRSLVDGGPIYGNNPRQGVSVLQEDAMGWETQPIYRGDDPADVGNFATFEDETLATTWASRSDVRPYTTSLFYSLRTGSTWQNERVFGFPFDGGALHKLVIAGDAPYIVWMLSSKGGLQIAERIEMAPTSVVPLPLLQVGE